MQNSVVYVACGYAVILVMACFRFIVKCTCACVCAEDCQNCVRAYCAFIFSAGSPYTIFTIQTVTGISLLSIIILFKGNLALYVIDEAKRGGVDGKRDIGSERNKGERLRSLFLFHVDGKGLK